jgi:hypothetical protein
MPFNVVIVGIGMVSGFTVAASRPVLTRRAVAREAAR